MKNFIKNIHLYCLAQRFNMYDYMLITFICSIIRAYIGF